MAEAGWRIEDVEDVRLLRCEALEAIPGLAHAFSTRIADGRSNFDLGPAEGEAPDVRTRRRRFLRAAGFGAAEPAILRQVHGSVIVEGVHGWARPPAADGVFQVAPSGDGVPVPAVRTADCVAVLVADRRASAWAAVHAGWRGAAGSIGAAAVTRFMAAGIPPADLVVACGPAILGCCYEVGDEVVEALASACGAPSAFTSRAPSGRTTVDLHAALRAQFAAAGVPVGAIHAAPHCTRCRNDLFFSFRAEGEASGRLIAAIGPAAGP